MDTRNFKEQSFLQSLFDKAAQVPDYEDYLVYYREEMRSLLLQPQLHERRQDDQDDPLQQNTQPRHAASSIEDIISIGKVLATSAKLSRSSFRKTLQLQEQARFGGKTDASLDASVNLTIRLALMLNVRVHNITSYARPDSTVLHWDERDTLEAFITHTFPQADEKAISREYHRIDNDLTAIGLKKYRGIEIKWTSSLEDHLRLKYDRASKKKRLKIFPYKQFLVDHLALHGTGVSGPSILPQSLVKETLWTLDLLLPHWHEETQAFLQTEKQHCRKVLSPEPAPWEFRSYRHWRLQLMDLQRELDAPPPGLLATLQDYRNPLQWWTFCLAVLISVQTLVFGAIASVLAGLLLQDALRKSREGEK